MITASEGKTRKEGRKLASSYALGGGLGLGTPSPDEDLWPEEQRERPEAARAAFTPAFALCDQGRDPTYGGG